MQVAKPKIPGPPALYLDGLFPHQADGVARLIAHPRHMLAWEMGTGKTATLLRAWENSAFHGPALVLCLASARENWRREALRFAIDRDWPPRVQVIRGSQDRAIDPTADIVIANYDKLLIRTHISALRSRRWGALICDEAHVLKQCDAQRTIAVYGGGKGHGTKPTPLKDTAERVWLATGTPMPNHPAELWTHAYNLAPETLMYNGHPMELWEFELGFCQLKQNKYGMQVTGGRNLAELKERMAPFVHRLKRKDVLTLPPLMVDSWPLDAETIGGASRVPDLPELMATLSERYGAPSQIDTFDHFTLEAYLASIQGEYNALATLRRETSILKAVATGILINEELDQGAPKTALFCHHRDAIATLEKMLRKHQPAIIHGSIEGGKRQDEIDRFQSDPDCHVFIGQLTAAGASINLQAAERVVLVEASWCPADNEQAIARVYRQGQTKPVFVRFVYLAGSIDEAVQRALARKAAMISQVID